MGADDENPSTRNIAIFIFLPVVIILLILVIAITLATITLLVRWKKREKHCPAQLDHELEERIYDMPHFPLDSSNSATKCDDVKPNVAYGRASISGTGCDDVKYVKPNVAYGKVNILGT